MSERDVVDKGERRVQIASGRCTVSKAMGATIGGPPEGRRGELGDNYVYDDANHLIWFPDGTVLKWLRPVSLWSTLVWPPNTTAERCHRLWRKAQRHARDHWDRSALPAIKRLQDHGPVWAYAEKVDVGPNKSVAGWRIYSSSYMNRDGSLLDNYTWNWAKDAWTVEAGTKHASPASGDVVMNEMVRIDKRNTTLWSRAFRIQALLREIIEQTAIGHVVPRRRKNADTQFSVEIHIGGDTFIAQVSADRHGCLTVHVNMGIDETIRVDMTGAETPQP